MSLIGGAEAISLLLGDPSDRYTAYALTHCIDLISARIHGRHGQK
jgi:hypothetical protein